MVEDIMENEMQQANIAAFLRCLDENGNSKVIAPSNLFNKVFIDRDRLYKYDDTSLKTGMYYDFDGAKDRNPILNNYGMILVFSYFSSMTIQIHVDTSSKVHIRTYANNNWSKWNSIAFTS